MGTLIVGVIVAAIAIGAGWSLYKDKKAGKCSGCKGCSGCNGSCSSYDSQGK